MKNTRAFPGEAEAADLADLGLALELSKASHNADTAAAVAAIDHHYASDGATAGAAGGGGGGGGGGRVSEPEVDLLGLMGGEESGAGGGGGGGSGSGDGEFQRGRRRGGREEVILLLLPLLLPLLILILPALKNHVFASFFACFLACILCHIHPPHNTRKILADITIDSAEFQSLWGRLGGGVESSCDLSRVPASTEEVEGLLAAKGVRTMASGNKPAAMKFFFYAKVSERGFVDDKAF